MGRGEELPKRLLFALAAAILGGCSTPMPLLSSLSRTLPDSHVQTEGPDGFIDFCARVPEQCPTRPGARTVLALDDKTSRLLADVNRSVNASIKPENDDVHYGRGEFWTIPTDGYGDCEDYALAKRKDLLDAGLPASALRLAVVYSVQTALHAVLTVSTEKGDLVLNNMTDEIVPWNATDFVWIMVQDPANPLQWDALQPAYAVAQVMGRTPDTARAPSAQKAPGEAQ